MLVRFCSPSPRVSFATVVGARGQAFSLYCWKLGLITISVIGLIQFCWRHETWCFHRMVVDLPRSLWAGPPQGGSFTARMSHIVVLPSGVRPLGVLKINH